MYVMSHFTEKDLVEVTVFMKAHPFITLIGNEGAKSVATQVPILIKEENGQLILRGHIMRKTDHHLAFEKNEDVLAMFIGPQCYISASWYDERGHGGTWNYMTVHTKGKIKLLDDNATIQLLTDLTHRFEEKEPVPELVENMTKEYLNSNVKAITAFEISIHSLHPIFKLSQNRNDESYQTIVNKLSQQSNYQAREIASEMIKRRPQLF